MLKIGQKFRFKSEQKFTELFGIGPCDGIGGKSLGWHLDKKVMHYHFDSLGCSFTAYPQDEFLVTDVSVAPTGQQIQASHRNSGPDLGVLGKITIRFSLCDAEDIELRE